MMVRRQALRTVVPHWCMCRCVQGFAAHTCLCQMKQHTVHVAQAYASCLKSASVTIQAVLAAERTGSTCSLTRQLLSSATSSCNPGLNILAQQSSVTCSTPVWCAKMALNTTSTALHTTTAMCVRGPQQNNLKAQHNCNVL